MFSDSFKVEKLKLNELNVSRKAEIESKIFPFKHFHDSPKRVFYFRVVREFVFLFVFSSSLFVNHFQSAKEQSLQKMNLVSLYSNRKSPFPKFRSLYVVVWKVISLIFFPLKSARNCPPCKLPKASKFSLTDKSKSREEADSSSKIFQQQIRLFPFFTMPPNARDYARWRFAWAFLSWNDKGNAGANATTSASVAKCA